MSKSFWDAVTGRRSYYALGDGQITSDERVMELVREAVRQGPSAFNSQSGRLVVLFGDQHRRLWDITKNILKNILPAEGFAATKEKIEGCFEAGHGTVLFFEDQDVVTGLQEKFPPYADNFPVWSNQSSAMVQYIVWTGLEAEGWGCSLQHYNPLIDQAVAEQWELPSQWKLIAQMPFGVPKEQPAPKETAPVEPRVLSFS